MGDIRGIVDWFSSPCIDKLEENYQFEDALRNLKGIIGALKELESRIPDLDNQEKEYLDRAIKNYGARLVTLHLDWIDFTLNKVDSISDEERKIRLNEALRGLRNSFQRFIIS